MAMYLAMLIAVIFIALPIAGCHRGGGEIPELSKRSSYSKIFDQIDLAEAKTDPVERCQSYPSPPPLLWSDQLTRVYCADIFAPVMQASDIKPLIDRGDWNALDKRYSEYLDRHYSGIDPEKLLYRAFPRTSWKNSNEADIYTRKWVSAKPDNAFANTARGAVLITAAWKERGSDYANKIPVERKRRMYKLAVEATEHLRKAIATEPKLLPAYYHLIDAYMLGGRSDWIPAAMQAALDQSPDSYYIREQVIEYMQRKWGGSRQGMDALIENAEHHIKKNPRLAMIRSYRDMELGDLALGKNDYKRALAHYREALSHGPNTNALYNAAYVAPKLGYYAEKIIYLTEDIRFDRAPYDSLLRRGAMWEFDSDFKRAIRDYESAKQLDPTNKEINKRLATAKSRQKAFIEGQKH
jgi:tetratricopeptide (TPR) repeat protein